jgi:malate dehydrogenase (quinone)
MTHTNPTQAIQTDIIIIWWWVSWSSLAMVLAGYTDVKSIALLEKESKLGAVNSKSTHNSQTLHEWNIESNYTVQKAEKISKKANMLKRFLETYVPGWQDVYTMHHKMLLAIGKEEIDILTKRYHEFTSLFPDDQLLNREQIEKYEPLVTKWRPASQPIAAHFSPHGYTIDFGKLSRVFIDTAHFLRPYVIDVYTSAKVESIEKNEDIYTVTLEDWRIFAAKALMVAAWWHTPLLLKQFHKKYPKETFVYGDGNKTLAIDDFSILSVAWSFFNSQKKILNGKVYTMQDPELPFAAVHGDPEVHNTDITRFGPTALWIPKLERYKAGGMREYLKIFEFSAKAFSAIYFVLSKDKRKKAKYLGYNFFYELPYIGKRLFAKEIRKIVPTLEDADIEKAKWYGGTRPQILNTSKSNEHWLDFGEAKFATQDGSAVFSITPSPGATTCLGNAYTDAQTLMNSSKWVFTFNKAKFDADFGG